MPDVLTSTATGIRVISLNRPGKRNALNSSLIGSLSDALTQADTDESLRAIVIRGEGKDFCSGADLASIRGIAEATYEENVEDARMLADLFELIRKVRMPVIAGVHGRALAGGCGLAMACDLIVATDTASFGYPEVKIGFVPAMVAAIVRRNLGEKEAFALLTQGFTISAIEANSIHLINATFAAEGFDDAVLAYASQYAQISGSAVAMTKRILYDIDADDISTAIAKGVEINARARMTDDCKKGIAKFLEK